MAAVVDIRTASGFARTDQPDLRLIESPVDRTRIYRVYLKRRLLMAVAVLAALVTFVMAGAKVLSASSTSPMTVGTHVVMPDETLWSIAKDARPGHDPRSTIMIVADLNSVGTTTFDAWAPLTVGQRIRVPVDR